MKDDSAMNDPSKKVELTEVSQVFRHMASRFQKGVAPRRLVYYFSIDDDKWTVIISPDSCEVLPGKTAEEADCFLKTSGEIFLGITRGDYNPSLTDFIMGRMKSNNPLLLQTFNAAFSRP